LQPGIYVAFLAILFSFVPAALPFVRARPDLPALVADAAEL
jgi:hypothetical protein